MASRLTDEERAQIEAALLAGESLHATAGKFERSKETISRIARAAGITFERLHTEKAAAARRDYALAERVGLLNQYFDRAEAMLPYTYLASEFQQMATALAILIDKRRLED